MKNIRRREFLKQSALGVGGILLTRELAGAAESSATHFDPYERIPLGKTKLKVSRLCLGTGMHGGYRQSNQTRLGATKFDALIQGAYERGVRTFDAADLYGSHPFLAAALKDMPRENYVIMTKIWWNHGGIPDQDRPDADVVIARFLKELKTDYIDLVLLHCVTSPEWPTELRKQMDIMETLKQKGTIRAHGVSCHSLGALSAAADEPWVDSVHTRINPYGMSMDGSTDEVVPILKKIHGAGKGVVGMKLVGEGRLRNSSERRQESIKYVLGLGCVDVLNVGFESLDETDDFAALVRNVPLTA